MVLDRGPKRGRFALFWKVRTCTPASTLAIDFARRVILSTLVLPGCLHCRDAGRDCDGDRAAGDGVPAE